MRTVKLTISYDGTRYVGWQIQPRGMSIQGVIQDALAKMTREEISLSGASRTDAGVHAWGQVAHFRTESKIPCEGFVSGLNSLLPSDISILDASVMSDDFNSRKDAKKKRYLYRILISRERLPLFEGRCWRLKLSLDIPAMQRAAKVFIGKKDFSSFRAAGSGARNSIREISKIDIRRSLSGLGGGRYLVDITVEGGGFVRHMVRNIVGTLVEVGKGTFKTTRVRKILAARDRKQAGVAAPACGLYLVKIYY